MNSEDKENIFRLPSEEMLKFERVAVLAKELYISIPELSPEECFTSAELFFEEYDKRRKEIDG